TTRAPSRAHMMATCFPIPEVEPVTRTRSPAKRMVGASCLGRGADAELSEDRRGVEIHPLAHDGVAAVLEEEERRHRTSELASRSRRAEERTAMRAEQIELDDDRIVGMPQGQDLVPLVRERGARRLVVPANGLLTVEDLAGGNQLVARMAERREGGVELAAVLRFHVAANDHLATVTEVTGGLGHQHCQLARRRAARVAGLPGAYPAARSPFAGGFDLPEEHARRCARRRPVAPPRPSELRPRARACPRLAPREGRVEGRAAPAPEARGEPHRRHPGRARDVHAARGPGPEPRQHLGRISDPAGRAGAGRDGARARPALSDVCAYGVSVSQASRGTTRTGPNRDSSAGRISAALPTTTMATSSGPGMWRSAALLASFGVTAATRDT